LEAKSAASLPGMQSAQRHPNACRVSHCATVLLRYARRKLHHCAEAYIAIAKEHTARILNLVDGLAGQLRKKELEAIKAKESH